MGSYALEHRWGAHGGHTHTHTHTLMNAIRAVRCSEVHFCVCAFVCAGLGRVMLSMFYADDGQHKWARARADPTNNTKRAPEPLPEAGTGELIETRPLLDSG